MPNSGKPEFGAIQLLAKWMDLRVKPAGDEGDLDRYLLQFCTRGAEFYLIGGCECGSGNQVVSMMDLANFGST
jgi:hypothetical protein